MAESTRELPDGYEELAIFDSRTNPLNRRVSYIMHFAAAIFFVPLFAAVTAAVRPGRTLDPVDLWALSIPGFGALGSVLVMLVVVVGVINAHILLHAAAYRYLGGAEPSMTGRRLTVAVSAPQWYVPKRTMIVIVMAPFFIISGVGAILLALVADTLLAWIFVPLVANGVKTAGDILRLSWLIVTPAGTVFQDAGTVLTAYAPADTVREARNRQNQ